MTRRERWGAMALAAVGLVIHGWFALGADAQDTDRSLVLLMARHFARGEWAVYFWQQNYMGALEPLLLTPLAWMGLATPVAAAFVGVGVTAVLATFTVLVARRLGATWWLVLLLWAVPPAVVVHHHVALYGARLVATLLIVAALAWSVAGPGRRGWVGVGVLVGVAYFGDHLMLPWALGIFWLASGAGALGRVATGALPVVALDTLAAILTPAAHLSGPNDPGGWLDNVPLLFGTTLPQLFGLLLSRGPTPVFREPASVVPSGPWWLPTALPALAVLVAVAVTLVRRRREVFTVGAPATDSKDRDAVPRERVAQALLLVVAATLGLFTVVGGGGDVWPARYLVPLWPALAILLGLAVARWPHRWRPAAGAVVLPALFTLAVDEPWPRGGDGTTARDESLLVAEAVERSGVEAVWADYWDAYRMALLVGEDPPWLPLRIIERRPDWLQAALTASPAGYLVRPDDQQILEVLDAAPQAGIAVLEDRRVGPYRWVVTGEPVPGAILRPPPPPRGWQVLAALSAGALFLGALAGVAALPRLRRPRRWTRPSLPSFPSLLRANLPVLWSWLGAVVLPWSVQLREGLGQPSQGLALSTAALPATLVALAPSRLRPWVMAAVVTLLGTLAAVDTAYHRFFGVYTPLGALQAAGQGWRVRGYASELFTWGDAWIPAVVVATLALAWRLTRTEAPPLSRRWRVGLPMTLCVVGSLPALGWAWLVSPGSADSETGGYLYAHLVDARRAVAERRMEAGATPETVAAVREYLERRAADAPSALSDDAAPGWGVATGSSVIMVQVEALNLWLLEAEVGGEAVMPFLRSLEARAFSFTNVFDQTHQGRSSDADYLAMASQHPLPRDAVSMVRPELDPVALPDILAGDGYATFSAHAHIPGFWNSARRHRRYGFQESLFEAELGPGEEVGFGLTDQLFFQRTVSSVAALPRPFLAWFITLTMHGPHPQVPPSFRTLPLGELEGTSLGNFLLKARHTDQALAAFVDSLSARGIMDDATLVVYGDHTESNRFDLAWVHRVADVEGLPADAQHLLLDRVPLLVIPPGGTERVRVDVPGGLLDIAPTVLHVLGRSSPPWFMGRSLLQGGPGVVAQASGEAVSSDLGWSGEACYRLPDVTPVSASTCDGIRRRAGEELEASWLITRHGLGPPLAEGTRPH